MRHSMSNTMSQIDINRYVVGENRSSSWRGSGSRRGKRRVENRFSERDSNNQACMHISLNNPHNICGYVAYRTWLQQQLKLQVVYENKYTYWQIHYVRHGYYVPYQLPVTPFQILVLSYQTVVPPRQMQVVPHQKPIEWNFHYVELANYPYFGIDGNVKCNEGGDDFL